MINEQTRIVGQKVINGELSPIAYYMEISIMDLKILSQYMGLSKGKVKKHLLPQVFEKLDETLLQQYADLFNISLEKLKSIGQIEQDLIAHED